ncbi:DUF2490 domain-containing protein [Bacteroidales bacterium OttesenSCG-928-J19]|nr:DUF2490 domain-containing protein [Bacteroidales bacterium OttesenSCG-928-J19]
MRNRLIKYICLCLFLLPTALFAQQEGGTDLGGILSLEGEKDLNRFFSLSFEEEVRFVTNTIGFDRSMTTVGIDYALFDRKVKLGAYYAFIYLYNSKYCFEPRHRYYFNLAYRETLGQFTLSWRGRVQGTTRDEDRGRYKINPKYMMKNRFEVEYSIWGRPWKPFFSCDLSTELNDPTGNDLSRIRFQTGTSWRLNRTDYLNFYLRWDEYLVDTDPRVFSLGIGFKRKF